MLRLNPLHPPPKIFQATGILLNLLAKYSSSPIIDSNYITIQTEDKTMKIINSIAEMQEEGLNILRSGMTHGLVPTMGALHDGHLSLIEAARDDCDIVTVSIFLNPTQFNDESDLEKYPKTFEEDMEKAAQAGADIIFAPTAEDMYSQNRDTVVMVDKLANHLCGISRGRGHFIGVCTVVTKLFNITRAGVCLLRAEGCPTGTYYSANDY